MSSTVELPTTAGHAWLGHRGVAWLCRTAVLLAIVGVFGTWRSAGVVSLNGLEGPHNGWEVIIFGLISLTGIRALSRGSWLGIVTVLGCAAIMTYTAVKNVVDDNAVLGGSSGWGVWLTIAGSVVLGATAVLAAVQRLRPRDPDSEEVGELVPEPVLEAPLET